MTHICKVKDVTPFTHVSIGVVTYVTTSVCICVCFHDCVCVRLCGYVCVYMCAYVHFRLRKYIGMFKRYITYALASIGVVTYVTTFARICASVFMSQCAWVCLNMCLYVCVCVPISRKRKYIGIFKSGYSSEWLHFLKHYTLFLMYFLNHFDKDL